MIGRVLLVLATMPAASIAGQVSPSPADTAQVTVNDRVVEAQRPLRSRPTLQVWGGYAGDSDGLDNRHVGLQADVQAGLRSRLGLGALVLASDDGVTQRTLHELRASIAHRTASVRSTVRGGLARAAGDSAWTTFTGDARLRWHAAASPRLGIDLRAQRIVLAASPTLLANRAIRSEVIGHASVPVGPLVVRGGGRAGRVDTRAGDNTRTIGDAIIVLPLGSVELSAQYHRLGYARATDAGFFAPERVETLEGGIGIETESDRVSLSLDAGIGRQRVRKFGEAIGPWRLALRGWAAMQVTLQPRLALQFEVEGYDAPVAVAGVSVTDHWKYLAGTAGVRWIL